MSNFLVPFVNEDKTVTPKKANTDAFYGAAFSSDPVQNYETIKSDLIQNGESQTLSAEQERWQIEKDAGTKQAVTGIMGDATISNELKRAILQGYAVTGSIPTSLKNRYIEKTASLDNSITNEDILAQDEVIKTLPERLSTTDTNLVFEKISSGYEEFGFQKKEYGAPVEAIKGVSGVVANLFMSIPAGFAGLYTLVKEHDVVLADQIISEVQSYAYLPKEEGAQKVMQSIIDAASTLGIPAQEIGNYINQDLFSIKVPNQDLLKPPTILRTKEGHPGSATVGSVILDPLNWLPFGLVAKYARKTPAIPSDSALEITKAANPAAATILAETAIKDPSGKLAGALGVDKGAIIHDWVLPKILPNEVAKAHPDLMGKINATDEAIRESFQDLRYDPSILNATQHEADVAKTFQIIKESRSPYYNQSMSLINETDQLFKGKAVFGRNGNYGYRQKTDAEKAMFTLEEAINQLPRELRGQLSISKEDNQHYVVWQWEKEYDELANKVFGKDSINTSMLGMDVSGVARSSAGRWFFPVGRFPQWVEQGALTGIERSAKFREALIKPIRDNIAKTPYGKQLDYIINHAEENGIDYYSPARIASMFPDLSKAQAENLFETHTLWRRAQHYNHNFLNREVRHKLVADNMQGMYDKAGNYLGSATDKVGPAEIAGIREVWDMESNIPVKYDADAIEAKGYKLVRLHEKVKENNHIYNYGIVGGKINLDLLPNEVLARIPGYSGRKVQESWYVDVTPKKLIVNGLTKSDANGLRDYTETKAAARNEAEADKIAEQLQSDYPDHLVVARPERTENFGRVMTDYGIHQQLLSHSMKRGERLPSLNGPARLEDRMVTLLNTIGSLSRMGAFRAWDDAFQKSFVKGYNKFTQGEFPQYATDIKPLENMGRELKQEYDNAHALFKYYERMKNNETQGDFLYTKGLHSIADILEKWKVPADVLRGNKKNPLMLAKTVATVAYIHLNPVRQWFIQPAQQLEMYAISPSTAAKNFTNMIAIRGYIGAESSMMKAWPQEVQDSFKKTFQKQGELAGNKEFLDDVEAIKRSGMMQSVDMNSLVHGVFKEVDRHLVENVPEKVWKDIESSAKVPVRLSRSVGFDAAEITNRVGNWLQMKDLWKLKNPGKDWKTKESQAEISAEALKLSGAMNRAGLLPYQEGTLSIAMQFAAINQKMLMNVLQDNATILTGPQRARLAAARFALFGGKYGIPGGAIAYHFIEKSDDPEVKKGAEVIKRGLIDYSANHMLAALVEPNENPDLAVSKTLTPYSEGFLPYFQTMWEAAKLLDNQPTNPRFPAFGITSSIGQAVEDIQGWFTTREVTEGNYKQMFMEAAEIASGGNSVIQGWLMLGMQDKITKMGNKYGMEFAKSEAMAKMIAGFNTQKEEDLWQLVQLDNDIQKQKTEIARMVFRQMQNQRTKLSDDDYAHQVQRINSFVNLLDPNHFSEADKLDIISEIEKLDTRSYKTIKQSILVDTWKYHQEKPTAERKQVMDILRRSPDPETQKFIKALDEGRM